MKTIGKNRVRKLPQYLWKIFFPMVILMGAVLLGACHDDPEHEPPLTRHTVMLFMPWSNNMVDFFEANIEDFEKSIAEGILQGDRVVVCLATDAKTAIFMELKNDNGKAVRDTFQVVAHPNYTLRENLTDMLVELRNHAPAQRYSLIIGGHGMAWLPADTGQSHLPVYRMPYDKPITRWFGGLVPAFQIEIHTLAEAIASTGIHMDYILFDDCYMSSVEVAYELRQFTDYIIACPSEIMAYGFPYYQCARYLVGNVNYQKLCEAFLDFYSDYYLPYGTVAVTDCRQLQALADVVRTININYSDAAKPSKNIQSMDGFDPPLFYDMGDTFDHICPDSALLARFHEQLSLAVPYKACTDSYYSTYMGRMDIRSFSGITTSEISANPDAAALSQTKWYMATH